MNLSKPLNYIFRKYPALRWISGILLVGTAIVVTIILSFKSKQVPEISSINPSIGAPGDLVVIKGSDFGQTKDTNYVEIGGSRLTSSSILSWTDSEIKLILPANIQDGLVYVGNKDSRSQPKFFANSTIVPVAVSENPMDTMPVIAEFQAEKLAVGNVLTIKGLNFGNTREKSKVYFTSCRDVLSKTDENSKSDINQNLLYIPASEDNYEYAYWSDSEIHVIIPDGTASGNVFIHTNKGNSPSKKITLDSKTGTKHYSSPKTYVVKVSVDVEDSANEKDSTIILRCPRPVISVSQPAVTMTENWPEPVIADFQHTVIHQTSLDKSYSNRKKFYQNFAVTVYETETKVKASAVSDYSSKTKASLDSALTSDSCVNSSDENVVKLAAKIIQKETNPYTKAKLIYDYMLQNFVLLQDMRNGKISPLDLLRTKKGDAYDFAICFTALLRAAKIPAIPDSGILISPNLQAQNHWWTEFYIEDFGWIPCDIAIAAGLEYQKWTKEIDEKSWYFGNLDSQHVTFSRGLNEIKPGYANNKIVQRQRSYALQSIWEEASGTNIKYSSYWSDPVVIGVY